MIGLLGSDQYWQLVLRQEGVSLVTNSLNKPVPISVLVLDRVPTERETSQIAEYARAGGAVLADARSAARVWPELRPSRHRIRYLLPDGSPFFHNVGPVDLETVGWQLPDARYGSADSGRPALAASQLARGWLVVLPFEAGRVIAEVGSQPRRFFADTPRFPTETVSKVSRGEVRRLLANCLRWLLNQQGLPYVHLAYVPSGCVSILGLRVDTDFGSRAELEATAELARQAGMKLSWYVNVGHHRSELDLFGELARAGHEVGLHCLRHAVSRDYRRNRVDFEQAQQVMRAAGLDPVGAAAPYGEWHPSLGRVYHELGFAYSSEFSYGYDDLPSRPVAADGTRQVWQVPVHPICTGRLLAARAVKLDIYRYFRGYVRTQVARQEPCLLYDHPAHLVQGFDVWRELLEYGQQECGAWTTLGRFARFWQRRDTVRLEVAATKDRVAIELTGPADDCPVVVELAGRQALLPPVSGEYQLDELVWVERPAPVRFDPLFALTRRPDLAFEVRELRRRLLKHLQSRRAWAIVE